MDQGGLFDQPREIADVRSVSPTGEKRPPFAAGNHASWSGANAVAETWPMRVSAYLQLLASHGALDDFEAFQFLRWGSVTSVNSVRGWLRDNRPGLIVEDGFNAHTFVDAGGTERTTRRTRFRLSERQVIAMSGHEGAVEDDGTKQPETTASSQADGHADLDPGDTNDTTTSEPSEP